MLGQEGGDLQFFNCMEQANEKQELSKQSKIIESRGDEKEIVDYRMILRSKTTSLQN